MTLLLTSYVPAEGEPPGAPRCRTDQCRYKGYDEDYEAYYYEVEGNTIEINYNLWLYKPALQLTCDVANVLESPALPKADLGYYLQMLVLFNCPLPANGSLQNTLATLNMTFCKQDVLDKPCQLWIYNLTSMPVLSAKHLIGLDQLQGISLHNSEKTGASIERGFYKDLNNLRKLIIEGVKIPAGELDAVPPLLDELLLEDTGTERLPEVIYSSTNLRELSVIENNNSLDAGAVPPGLRQLVLESIATMLRLDAAPALESLRVNNWVEPLPPPITHCAELIKLLLKAPAMHALPDKWLANCLRLEEVEILEARNLTTLPSTMFNPANIKFTRLSIRQGTLEMVPEKLIYDLPALQYLELDNNKLQTIPRYFFNWNSFRLIRVDFSSNDLDGSAFESLRGLWSQADRDGEGGVTVLNLLHNPRIGNVCGADGYSSLRRMSGLHSLILRGTGVPRICEDWKKKMPELKLLDLRNTSISKLSFEDLQYDRTVKAKVLLQGAPMTEVRITREDYNTALRAPPSFTTLHISRQFECDCRMYWARRALEAPLHALDSIRELRCVGGGLLRDLPPEAFVCAAREECAAARMPVGCECAACPDEDSHHDRWMVRVRCKDTTNRLVARRLYPFYPSYKPINHAISEGKYYTTIGSFSNL